MKLPPIIDARSILAIDCGLRVCGYAEARYDQIHRAGIVRNSEKIERGPMAWRAMAREVMNIWGWGNVNPDLLIIETQQVYKSTPNPDDLLELMGVAGAIAAMFECPHIIGVKPRVWKGSVPKDVHHKRLVKRLGDVNLGLEEIPKGLVHNAWDGIGLAYYAIDKYGAK